MEYIIYGILAISGFVVGWWIRRQSALTKVNSAETKAQKILIETKAKQKELLLKAQDKALKIIGDAKNEDAQLRQDTKKLQRRLEKRERIFSQKLLEL